MSRAGVTRCWHYTYDYVYTYWQLLLSPSLLGLGLFMRWCLPDTYHTPINHINTHPPVCGWIFFILFASHAPIKMFLKILITVIICSRGSNYRCFPKFETPKKRTRNLWFAYIVRTILQQARRTGIYFFPVAYILLRKTSIF